MASQSTGGGAGPRKGATRVAPHPAPKPEDRDPNKLNSHIVVDFHSVFAEPNSPRSFDCTWEFSELCYDCWFDCLYKFFSLLCGCWIAMYWGCQIVPVVFSHVWIFTPIYKCLQIICGSWCKTYWTIMARCCIAPWTKAFSYIFIHCGDGHKNPPKTPPLFPSGKRRPKPVAQPITVTEEPESEVIVAVVPMKREFDDYDKEKIARSVRRQMMLI